MFLNAFGCFASFMADLDEIDVEKEKERAKENNLLFFPKQFAYTAACAKVLGTL